MGKERDFMVQDQQDRTQARRIAVNVVIEIVMLAILGAVLWTTSNNALESQQRANAESKLATAHERIVDARAYGDELLEQFDTTNQNSVNTLAYFYNRNEPQEVRFTSMADAWGLVGLYLVDGTGAIEISSVQAPTPDTSTQQWADLVSSGTPFVAEDGTHFYSSHISGDSYLVGSADPTETLNQVAIENDLSASLSSLHVGEEGYLVAVDRTDGTMAYAPQDDVMGRAASEVFSEVPQPGFDGYVEYNGNQSYVMAAEEGDYTVITIVPSSEFTANASVKVAAVVIAFAVVSILIVCYCQFLYTDDRLRRLDGRAANGSFVKLGKKYVINTAFVKKSLPILVVGTIGVFLISWYAQSLVSLSRQIVFNDHNIESVEQALDGNDERAESLIQGYSSEYIEQAEAFSHLLAADTRLIDHTHLVELAELDGLESIYVFNEAGETIATSTTRYDFALPEDETDQSYGFWDVVKGYETSFVQDVYWSDGTGMTFFVGVPRYDEKGMVELGIPSTIPAERMQRTELTSLLASVPIGNDGFLMSVNAQDSTISYAENVRYIGQSAESHGVTAAALSDGYLGYQTIDGTTCLVSTVLTHDQYVMVCVPSSSIGVGDLSNAVITAILSFVLLLPCIGQLVIQRMPARGSDREERSTGVLQPQPKGPIDIKTTSGETKRVVPITGRWSGGMAAWSDKTPEAKLMAIVRALLLVVTAVVLVYVYAFQTSNSASALSFIISMRWEKVPNIFSFTYIGVFVLTAAMVVWVLRTVIAMTFRNLNARIETVGRLFSNFIKYGVWIGVLFYSLSLIGVDSQSLWASAGIVTLIVGLGAQSLIKDVIAGIFLVFEGEFRVGDIVTVGTWTGTVLEIGIRTTKIEDGSQNIKILNNSAIADVVNMTKKYSYATVDLTVSYKTPLEKLEALFKMELPHVAERLPKIVAGPFYKGVVSVGSSDMVVRVIAQCREEDRAQLTRDLTRQMLLVCDHNDIAPYSGTFTFFQPDVDATPEERKAAAEFVKEQSEATAEINLGNPDEHK